MSSPQQFIVAFIDRDHPLDDQGAASSRTFEVEEHGSIDAAYQAASEFAQEVLGRDGKLDRFGYYREGQGWNWAELPHPSAPAVDPANFTRYAVGWEKKGEFYGDAGNPLNFFDKSALGEEARPRAQAFLAKLRADPDCCSIDVDAYDERYGRWHRLDVETMELAKPRRPFKP